MECNKEEAIRAREIAEKKLLEKDYKLALKLSLKAQTLFPNLENLTQLLTVCSVHCSFMDKINGETDWYGILQVGTSADEIAIKKQYRKLALLLHPDKNKFPGAESAFKLIGEANGILTDRGKRSLHDVKRGSRVNNNGQTRRPPQAARTGQSGQTGQTGQTFWTICHFCGMKYQYFRSIYKKALRCQNCLQAFVAYDIDEMPNPNPNFARFNPVNGSASDANPFQRYPSPFCSQFQPAGTSSGTGTAQNVRFERVNLEKTRPPPAGMNFANKPPKSTKPQNKRRKRVIEEDEEESEADSSESEEEEEIALEKEVKINGSSDPPRRSSRQKQDVKYNEKDTIDDYLDDDLELDEEEEEEVHNRKRLRKGSNREKEKDKEIKKTEEEMETNSDADPKEFTYQDPEFFQFDQLRSSSRFAADQVWAVYDDRDGMPRFYARIKSVYTAPRFQLRFVWLESDPLTRTAMAWTRAALPVACGAFKSGKAEGTEELLMFSHEVDYSTGSKRNTFEIYPKKGETWALFKNWNLDWSADPDEHGDDKFEYEMVEVLSDFSDSTEFAVSRLVKINGFVSLFMHSRADAPFVVPVSETLRFSHRVPSYRTNGDEREGVPQGAFELDPASLPSDSDKVFVSIDLDLKQNEKLNEKLNNRSSEEKLNENLNNGNSKENENLDENLDGNCSGLEERTDENSESESPSTYAYLAPEFYTFAIDRTIEKFWVGQIWALYSDVDQFPKFYASVKWVDPLHEKVQIRWLEPVSEGLTGEVKRWVDQELPIGCGLFKITGKPVLYDCTGPFSHLVRTSPCTASGKKNWFEIAPVKNEIWALYRNWTVGWGLDDIKENCQYDLVQVTEITGKGIRVEILTKVEGYSSVFARDRFRKAMLVPKGEYIRFSHMIPSYRLGDEKDGTLRGCFELDPASVPEDLL